MDDRHSMATGRLKATVQAHGAELSSLQWEDGREAIWQAGPPWPRHAPWLFPIVGSVQRDTIHVGGRDYAMPQHGFARDRDFAWVYRTDTGCRLVLGDDAGSRAIYPFAFRLELDYAMADATLEMRLTLFNPGDVPLPASMGGHPAFNWPLVPDAAKPDHELVFDHDETAPVWNVSQGVLTQAPVPSPVVNRLLPLRTRLDTSDTTIFHPPASRSVTYGPTGRPMIRVDWEGFQQMAVWSRPDADLVCIEPWLGHLSPVGFDGEFADKPGVFVLQPGESRSARIGVTLL